MAGTKYIRCFSYTLHVLTHYSRNLALSLAAGNATLWKPSPSTPLCSIAVTKLISEVLQRNGLPGAVAGLVIGGKHVGESLVQSADVDMGMLVRICTMKRAHPISFLVHSLVHRKREYWKASC